VGEEKTNAWGAEKKGGKGGCFKKGWEASENAQPPKLSGNRN